MIRDGRGKHITENTRIYICTAHETRGFDHGAQMGPAGRVQGRSRSVCVRVQQISSLLLLSAVCEHRWEPRRVAPSTIPQRTREQNSAFRPLVLDANKRLCNNPQKCTSNKLAHTHRHMQSTVGITIFCPHPHLPKPD